MSHHTNESLPRRLRRRIDLYFFYYLPAIAGEKPIRHHNFPLLTVPIFFLWSKRILITLALLALLAFAFALVATFTPLGAFLATGISALFALNVSNLVASIVCASLLVTLGGISTLLLGNFRTIVRFTARKRWAQFALCGVLAFAAVAIGFCVAAALSTGLGGALVGMATTAIGLELTVHAVSIPLAIVSFLVLSTLWVVAMLFVNALTSWCYGGRNAYRDNRPLVRDVQYYVASKQHKSTDSLGLSSEGGSSNEYHIEPVLEVRYDADNSQAAYVRQVDDRPRGKVTHLNGDKLSGYSYISRGLWSLGNGISKRVRPIKESPCNTYITLPQEPGDNSSSLWRFFRKNADVEPRSQKHMKQTGRTSPSKYST